MDENSSSYDRQIKIKTEEETDGQQLDVYNLISLITKLTKSTKHLEALELCNKGLQVKPEHEKLLEKKIKILCQLGNVKEAYEQASKWFHRQPKHPIAIKEYGRLEKVLAVLQDEDTDDDNADESITVNESKVTDNFNKTEPDITVKENGIGSIKNTDDYDIVKDDHNGIGYGDLQKKKLSSDDEREWQYRAPPRGLSSDKYSLCPRYAENQNCTFGDKCTEAHSEEELKEWMERFKYKRDQLQKAREKLLHGNSCSEKLLNRLATAENPSSLLCQSIDNVKLHINGDLKVNQSNKVCTNAWTFTITSKTCLHNVVLLDDVNKSYFYISSISVGPKKTQKYQNLETHCQEWSNPDITNKVNTEYVYRVKVVFKTDIFGTFRQSIVFDFGLEKLLVREIKVESGHNLDVDKAVSDLMITEAKRWTEQTVNIVSFSPMRIEHSESEKNLLAKYVLPDIDVLNKPDSAVLQSLCKDNYRLWMHQMLYFEEMAQYSLISGFNVKHCIDIDNKIEFGSGSSSTQYSCNDELFAELKLDDNLSEDTISGRLILQNALTAWVTLPYPSDDKTPPKKAYESIIEYKGKNSIYLRLSETCVHDLKLKCNSKVTLIIQFQLNRLPKVEMHAGIDNLPTLDLVFPDMNQIPTIPWSPSRQWNSESPCKLNVKQKEAILAITASLDTKLPPLLIVGPFGTGKTYTLAQAAKLVLQNEGTRILICTHSNSAADLYIKDYFHQYYKDGNEDMKPLRILYKYRWTQTVSDIVGHYTLFDKSSKTFRYPTLEDLEKHRIIITTLSTARCITDIDLPKGFFSHIFIDEAAQTLECETIIPLALADESTRIVLAGDHMQLSPEVCHNFCRKQGFHVSLLERFHNMYPSDYPCKIMLCENYRSHSAVVDFTSELFYDNKLKASGKQIAHPQFYPLTFCAAKGEEVQHPNDTGFYNIAEVKEVKDRVSYLIKNWPVKEWGPFHRDCISVVTPYIDQVRLIRSKLGIINKVSVERVHNIQGKEYRVIILSTVRTQNTCRSDNDAEHYIDYGFLSNIKLLTTAITRAKSLVIVIGDPVSLCLVGRCRKVWEYFLELCNEHNSLYGMTWSQLRAQIDGIEMAKTYTLNPLAFEFVPNRLYHVTRAESEATGHNLMYHPFLPYWQQQYTPYSMFGYYPSPYSMYSPMMPFHPAVVPNVFGPMYLKYPLNSSERLHRHTSPHTSPNRNRNAAEQTNIRLTNNLSRNQMIMYPRLPFRYPNILPVRTTGGYFLPEDLRLHGLSHYQPQPYSTAAPQSTTDLSGTTHIPPSKVSTKSNMEATGADARESPSTTKSGQPVMFLSNVQHAPEAENRSTKAINEEKVSNKDSMLNSKLSDDRKLPISERPYSPANYFDTRMASNDLRSEPFTIKKPFSNSTGPYSQQKKPTSSRSEEQSQLQMNIPPNIPTGFSRQFSDDLPTPTEVKDIFQMIDESNIEEDGAFPVLQDVKNISRKKEVKELNTKNPVINPSPPKLRLSLPPSQSPESMGKMSYAGVLRKQPTSTSSPQNVGDGSKMKDSYSQIEAQTPRTPAGFLTPGGDIDMDPFGILKGLNIEPTSRQRSLENF